MKKFISIFYFLILANYLHSQTIYTIPWATVQPKFVFPIYFEEGTGMRDTIYICYDSLAHPFTPNIADTIFGQKLIYVDTTRFYVSIESNNFCNSAPLQCDSQYKSTVSPLSTGHFPISWFNFSFRNGLLPLKISWDISTLYSDSLPFPLNPGLPRAQGRFNTLGSPFVKLSENGQVFDLSLPFNILLSDTGSPALRDSCTAYAIDGNPHHVEDIFVSTLFFERWTGFAASVESNEFTKGFKIFPNPCNGILNFESKLLCESGIIKVCDLSGRIVFNMKISNLIGVNNLSLNLSEGAYIFNYSCANYIFIKVFLISK
jgi:hypothetical protein